jgi:hypothetical protein
MSKPSMDISCNATVVRVMSPQLGKAVGSLFPPTYPTYPELPKSISSSSANATEVAEKIVQGEVSKDRDTRLNFLTNTDLEDAGNPYIIAILDWTAEIEGGTSTP